MTPEHGLSADTWHAPAALLVGTGFGALAFARTPWTIAATVVIWTFGEMILLPSMANFVAEIAPEERRGEYMGYYTMAWGIAFSFGPGLGTLVLDRLLADANLDFLALFSTINTRR